MSSLRLKLPGAVYFASNIYSLFTGLAFTVIVTRSLTVSDFGLWTMISQYLAYTAGPLANIASFWVVRFVARGFSEAPKSGLMFGLILSSIGLPLYALVAFFASISFSQPLPILLLATPQVVTYILIGALSSIATGTSPNHVGVSNVIFETLKVVLAHISVRLLKMGLTGAIMSVMMAQAAQVIYLLMMLRGFVRLKTVNYGLIKKWVKLSWLPVYGLFPGLVGSLDVVIARAVSSTDALIGVRKVASIVGSFPNYVSSLSLTLYPRSLNTSNSRDWVRDAEELLKFMSLMAIPITVGNIVLMDLLLEIFGTNYIGAYLAGITLAIASLIGLMSSITDPILGGSETVDLKEEIIISDYLKSRLFKLVNLNCASSIVYLLAASAALILSRGDIYQTVLHWSLASFTCIPIIAYKIRMLKRINLHIEFPVKNVLRYFLTSLLMFLLVYVLKNTTSIYFARNLFGLLSQTLILTGVGGCFYFVIIYIVDDYAKKLFTQTYMFLRHALHNAR